MEKKGKDKSNKKRDQLDTTRAAISALKEPMSSSPKVAELAQRVKDLEVVLKASLRGEI
jgi:hypothetical protein